MRKCIILSFLDICSHSFLVFGIIIQKKNIVDNFGRSNTNNVFRYQVTYYVKKRLKTQIPKTIFRAFLGEILDKFTMSILQGKIILFVVD